MIQTIEAVLGMNQRAVQLLHDTHYCQAASLLRKALKLLRANLLSSRLQNEESSLQDNNNTCAVECAEAPRIQFMEDSKRSSDDAYFLCTKAYLWRLTSDNANLLEVAERNISCITSMILYNMGLALHLNFLTGHANESDAKSALRMYDSALKVLAYDLEKQSCLLSLTLACINNKGHICSMFYESTALHHCLGSMECLLQHLDDVSCNDAERELSYQLRMNIILFKECYISSAAAA